MPPTALLAHEYVPPVEAGSAYAPQAIAAPGDIVDVADENPSQSSSARRFLAINDRLHDESVDHDTAFGSTSVPREAARFLEEEADEIHPLDDYDEPLSEPMQEYEENAPANHFYPDFDDDEILVLESIDREQVLVDPLVFRRACKRLKFKPSADLSASATQTAAPLLQPYTRPQGLGN